MKNQNEIGICYDFSLYLAKRLQVSQWQKHRFEISNSGPPSLTTSILVRGELIGAGAAGRTLSLFVFTELRLPHGGI